MANDAYTLIEVRFQDPVDRRIGKAIAEDFSELFDCDDLYDETYDSEKYHSFKAEFNSNWSAPLSDLQQFCNSSYLSMKAIAYDSAGQQSEAFHLTAANKESFEILTTVTRDDLRQESFDVSKVSDETMEELADRMTKAYSGSDTYWVDLDVIADEVLGIPKAISVEDQGIDCDVQPIHDAAYEFACPKCATMNEWWGDIPSKTKTQCCNCNAWLKI